MHLRKRPVCHENLYHMKGLRQRSSMSSTAISFQKYRCWGLNSELSTRQVEFLFLCRGPPRSTKLFSSRSNKEVLILSLGLVWTTIYILPTPQWNCSWLTSGLWIIYLQIRLYHLSRVIEWIISVFAYAELFYAGCFMYSVIVFTGLLFLLYLLSIIPHPEPSGKNGL